MFTNTSCPTCPAPGKYLDSINNLKGYTIDDTNVMIIRYHTRLFPNDPFYLFNSYEDSARTVYYGVPVNPMGFLCGSMLPIYFDVGTWTTSLNLKLNETNTFGIELDYTLDTNSRNLGLNMEIGQLSGSQINDLRLIPVLTESNLYYTATNGERYFENIMRKMLDGPFGASISVNPGQTINVSKMYSIPAGIWISNCEVIVFVQSLSTKEVFGVQKLKIGNK